MTIEPLGLPGVLLIKPRIFRDERGRFLETWRASEFDKLGIGPFVQDNISHSMRGVLRGLHLQHPRGQGKLVSVSHGRAFDVAVDVRVGSPSFGRWIAVELDAENGWQLWIPSGFAHGYLALSDVAFCYRCTDYYHPEDEKIIRWNDPGLAIAWPVESPSLSPRDATAPLLEEVPSDALPTYTASP